MTINLYKNTSIMTSCELELSIVPSKYTVDEINKCIQTVIDNDLPVSKYLDLIFMKELITKYHEYQDIYENPENHYFEGFVPEDIKSPVLLDIVSSGCSLPGFQHSLDRVNIDEMLEDMKNAIRLIPESLECDLGCMRCGTNITPLMALCMNKNKNISYDFVKILLDNGADKNALVKINGKKMTIIKALFKYQNDDMANFLIKYEL